MKIFTLFFFLFFYSCISKETVLPVLPVLKQESYWKVDGQKFDAYATRYSDFGDNKYHVIRADDNKGNNIFIIFSFIRPPISDTEISVIGLDDGDITFTNSSECVIAIAYKFSYIPFFSRNNGNNRVKWKISKEGKFSAVFNNISVFDGTNKKVNIISGNLIED